MNFSLIRVYHTKAMDHTLISHNDTRCKLINLACSQLFSEDHCHPIQRLFVSSHHHSAVCLTTGPQHLPKRILYRVRPSASSFNFQYSFVSLRSSNSCLHLLPRLPVTSILAPITCFRRQFLRKMWAVQSSFLLFTVCVIFLSLSLRDTCIVYYTNNIKDPSVFS